MAIKIAVFEDGLPTSVRLTTESVEGSALSFQSVDDIHCGDGLSLGVLGVGDSITDHVLQENLENATGLFVNQPGDTFHTTSSCQSSDSWLSDTLDVVTENFPVTLGTSFSKTFSSFSTSRHFE